VEQAALALGLDAATAEVVVALAARDLDAVLLKGAAVAHWLYPDDPSTRTYRDVDLAVAPDTFERAEAVLRGLGFTCPSDDVSPREKAWLMETLWERPGSPPVSIDLHRGFHGVGDWPAWWASLAARSVALTVAGREVRVPDAAGQALVVALHDTAVDRASQSAEDLRRALVRFDREVWAEAARRAEEVQAVASFALGLSHHSRGRDLASCLGLSTKLPLEVAARAGAGPGADTLLLGRASVVAHRFAHAKGCRERFLVAWGFAFPSAATLRISSRIASTGRGGLALARVWRPVELVAQAPRVLLKLWRGYRGRDVSRKGKSSSSP